MATKRDNDLSGLWGDAVAWLTGEGLVNVVLAVVIALAGLVLARILSAALGRALAGRVSPQQEMISRRATHYAIVALALISALRQVGFDMSVLIGAAGILTVAIGFASQTSASNLISGLFLMGEKPFVIGDVIAVGATTGEVISVGLMSVKLRTFDNLLVRIPNESLLKSELTNMTHFPIRRLDMQLAVGYDAEIAEVREILLRVASDNPVCLDSPEPMFMFTGFGDSAMTIQFSVWAARTNFLELRNSMFIAIKRAFDEAGVEIPLPQRSLVAGRGTEPLPVRLVAEGAEAGRERGLDGS